MMLTDTLTRLKKEPLFPVRQADRQRHIRTTAETRTCSFAAAEGFWRGSDGTKGGELMEYSTQASLLQVRSTEQQRILCSTRSDINALMKEVQGIKHPFHNLSTFNQRYSAPPF